MWVIEIDFSYYENMNTNIATANYRNYMNKHNWERPRNYKSLDIGMILKI